jgi:hypothetical protein
MADVILNKFIVDGIHWEWVPAEFAPSYETHGIRVASMPQLDLSRIVITEAPTPRADAPNNEMRRVHRQMWAASWGSDAPMDLCMRDFLFKLYYVQKGFWVQFDNEMSRRGVQLMDLDGEGIVFFTPTYPIAPYGYTPVNGIGYKGLIRTNDGTWITDFTVDSEVGKVQIANTDPSYPVLYPDYVVMDYTWKAFVRIAGINLNPIEVTRNFYAGEVLFEQITPNYKYDPWAVEYYCTPFGIPIGSLSSGGNSIPSGQTIGPSNEEDHTVNLTVNTETTDHNRHTIFSETLVSGASTDPSDGWMDPPLPEG